MSDEHSYIPEQGAHFNTEGLPQCAINAGPHDNPDDWACRLNEEFAALIYYVEDNKTNDTEWFRIDCDDSGTK